MHEIKPKISRRDFLKFGLIGSIVLSGAGVAVCFEGDEIKYLYEKREAPDPFPKPATVLLVNGMEVGGGTFITPRHILTAKHLDLSNKFKIIPGTDYLGNYKNGTYWNNIEKITNHPDIDLALISLREPQTILPPASISKSEFSGGVHDKILTVVSISTLCRKEVFAGSKFYVIGEDGFIGKQPVGSYISLHNRVMESGDSGSGLYIEKTGELIGVAVSGSVRILGLNPNSYFINITNPNMKDWVEKQITA